MELFWDCFNNEAEEDARVQEEKKIILRKLGEINQNWLLEKIINILKNEKNEEIIRKLLFCSSEIKLKVISNFIF